MKGARGRGTLEKEKPPIFGMLQRTGEVVLQMLANVQQVTISPLIRRTIAAGTVVYTDEYDIYLGCPNGAMSITAYATLMENTPATTTATVFTKCTSTPSKDSGRCCGPG